MIDGLRFQDKLRRGLQSSSVAYLLIRFLPNAADHVAFGSEATAPQPATTQACLNIETWREVLSSNSPSLHTLIFQLEEHGVRGWSKDTLSGGIWREMSEHECGALIASGDLCPLSVEPCERCEK